MKYVNLLNYLGTSDAKKDNVFCFYGFGLVFFCRISVRS